MIDFNDPQFVADPYPALKKLREAPGPVWHEEMQIFLAARHPDANDVFRNKSLGRIFKDKTPNLNGRYSTGFTLIQSWIASHPSTPAYVHWLQKPLIVKRSKVCDLRLNALQIDCLME